MEKEKRSVVIQTVGWARELKKNIFSAKLISQRQGEHFCENREDSVLISGYAVTYQTGEIVFD